MRKLWAAGAAIVVCLALGGVPLMAQEASPAVDVTQRDVLFDVTVPVDAMPDELSKINLERQTIAPGMDGRIEVGNEAIRGRILMVDVGELVITPMTDAWVWPADVAEGGAGAVAAAGEPVALATGDVLLIPANTSDELDPAGSVGIANPGDVETVILGFHLHQLGGAFPGWPTGMSGVGSPTVATPSAMEAVSAGDTTFRMTRLTAQPGVTITLPDEALFAFYRVEEGALEQTTTGPGGTTTSRLYGGGTMEALPDVEQSMTVVGDESAVLLELAVIPSVATAVAEPEVPVLGQDDAAWITGSVSCEVSDWGTESQQGGVASIRDRLATCTVTANDPRASGAGLHVYNEDCHAGSCIDWGTYEVVGPDGSWSGPWTGVESPDGILTAYSQQSGSGGYAGWNLVTVNVCDCTTGTITLEGVMYEGPPPPYGLLPSPDSE